MFIRAVRRKARSENIIGKLSLMVNLREQISQHSEIPTVLLSALLNQLNQRNEIIVLWKQALECQQELVKWLHELRFVLLSSDALDLVVAKDHSFHYYLTDRHLETSFFVFSDFSVY